MSGDITVVGIFCSIYSDQLRTMADAQALRGLQYGILMAGLILTIAPIID